MAESDHVHSRDARPRCTSRPRALHDFCEPSTLLPPPGARWLHQAPLHAPFARIRSLRLSIRRPSLSKCQALTKSPTQPTGYLRHCLASLPWSRRCDARYAKTFSRRLLSPRARTPSARCVSASVCRVTVGVRRVVQAIRTANCAGTGVSRRLWRHSRIRAA